MTTTTPRHAPADDLVAFAPRRRPNGALDLSPPPRGVGPPGRVQDGAVALTHDAGRFLAGGCTAVDASGLPERWQLRSVVTALAVLASRQTSLEVEASYRLLLVLSGVGHPTVVVARCRALEELRVVGRVEGRSRTTRWALLAAGSEPVPAVPAVDPLWTDRGLGARAREACRLVEVLLPTTAELAAALGASEDEVLRDVTRLQRARLVRPFGPRQERRWTRVEGPERPEARELATRRWGKVVAGVQRQQRTFRTNAAA